MLINFIGSRGTHPSSGQGTMSFIVDNKIVFDICPEFVISYTKFVECWNKTLREKNVDSKSIMALQNLYGTPNFSKLEHIFLTHLHYDHWGGLRHFLIWSQMFESSFREDRPLHIYIPKKNIELFQHRFRELFDYRDKDIMEEEEFFVKYLLIEIDTSLVKFIRVHAIEHGNKVQIGKYEIEAFENKHFRGSISYKLSTTKFKLREEQLKVFQLEKGPILGKLQRESEIRIENQIIRVEDIFSIKKTTLGYSGDTIVDPELLQWFKECTHLVHESTYLTEGGLYHTDSHASLDKLIPFIKRFQSLKCFLPVHFSGRYTWEEVQLELSKMTQEIDDIIIYSPRLGSVISYEEKDETTIIHELELQGRF